MKPFPCQTQLKKRQLYYLCAMFLIFFHYLKIDLTRVVNWYRSWSISWEDFQLSPVLQPVSKWLIRNNEKKIQIGI